MYDIAAMFVASGHGLIEVSTPGQTGVSTATKKAIEL
jgi:hypothetical protein